ncbi:ribonuclease T [Phenylobacterium sp.]|uniref:ribonuclease T2 family protein n=1 Tax=Phenylobacterium sp. TaxID=1871053 RepID=UPI0025E7F0D1|nr:ribonuclease T [Phenylobacterium sp.]
MRLPAHALAAVIAATCAPAFAAPVCTPPPSLTPAPALTPRPDEVVHGVSVAYYVLALNWTPEWCRTGGAGASAKEMECGRPFGFTLHGLWPDGAHPPYPRFCLPAGALDAATVRQMYCRTPSPILLQHEWQAHGTCAAWASPQAYFGQAAALFDRLTLPRIERIPAGELTASAVRSAFLATNASLAGDEIYIQTLRGSGALSEVRICYDLKFKPTACPGGAGAPNGLHMTLAPSQTGAF